MSKQYLTSLFLLFSFILTPLAALAQTEEEFEEEEFFVPSMFQAVDIEGTFNCFDKGYYAFGSINVDLQADLVSVISGKDINFSGNVINKNNYPIVDGVLYIKIFKKQDTTEKNTAGPDVVDQFIAEDGINIPAQGQVPVEFSWNIPEHAVSGNYQAAAFFATSHKFNLLGLSFTDDIIGNTYDFHVIGEQESFVSFDKQEVYISGDKYLFASFPPRLNNDPLEISANLTNTFDRNATVEVTWELYEWDALSEDNLVTTYEETVILAAGETTTVRYLVTEADHPVYYAIGTAKHRDTTSIIGVRFVREDVQKTRLNFPGITDFPLRANQPNTLFACLHGMGTAHLVENNSLYLALQDMSGNTIHEYSYEGDVTGAVMGLKDEFTPSRSYDKFKLIAELRQDGEVVDEVEVTYDCEKIGGDSCLGEDEIAGEGEAAEEDIEEGELMNIAYIGWGLIGLAALILIGLAAFFLVRKKEKTVITTSLLLVIATLAAATGAGLLLTVPQEASMDSHPILLPDEDDKTGIQSSIWDITVQGMLEYEEPLVTRERWREALLNPYIQIKYGTRAIDEATGTPLTNESVVSVGDVIRFEFIPYHFQQIGWTGTGYSIDTPYGEWRENATSPPLDGVYQNRQMAFCEEKDFLQEFTWEHTDGSVNALGIYIPLVIHPPEKTIPVQQISGLECGAPNENGDVSCIVTNSDQASITLRFEETFGHFYYRWEFIEGEFPQFSPGECYGNDTPMRLHGSTFFLEPEAQEFTFSFDVEESDPPGVPVISGPTAGNIGTNYEFNVHTPNPGDHEVKYGIDWNMDGVVNEWVPAGGDTFVPPGSLQVFTNMWSTPGPKTFRALARSSIGGVTSDWSEPHTINIDDSDSPEPTPTPEPPEPRHRPGPIMENP